MSKRTELRRRDRARDDAWIRAFLAEVPFGFLATALDGRPFLNSNLFVYVDEEHAIYMHTARTGRTSENLESPLRACFSAAVVGRVLPAPEALEFSVEYASVVAFGTARRLDDPNEEEAALQRLLDRYAAHLQPGRDYRPITPGELRRTAVYRIDVEEWSGKENVAAPEFPGAFRVREPAIPLRLEEGP